MSTRVDARPDLERDQAFTFDSTPDRAVEKFFDDLDLSADVTSGPGPHIHGGPNEIEYRYDGGKTFRPRTRSPDGRSCSMATTI